VTQDIFTRWDPWWWYSNVPTTIAAIHDDWEGFRVILTATNCPDTRVYVPRLVQYRVFDEIGLAGLDHGGVVAGHSFYKSNSSPWLTEALRMNSATYGGTSVHYAIYTGDRCIDIVSPEEPRFVLLREFAAGRNESERPERTVEKGNGKTAD
jgi:hypothetical protein